ncbi:alpha-ketoglutarate-dependent dioxygenase AlkB family protein [Oceanomicrobium pacificus]|uniref:alpha-ketoglutarate-dependent dioxygenase AlkB family protein n=1 Tax=Oceanomicrobium pacificus TaxID=2692916 RepID=UPI002E2DFD76|nr:alpha-ketoglutarate-dependent dioxygenase AlkB [Oceanomicrobium pacificus]
MPLSDAIDLNGVTVLKGRLDRAAQASLVEEVRTIARAAPLTAYETPGGRRMSVRMTAAGRVGWVSDRSGYRYAPTHPSGIPWPPIPASILSIWRAETGVDRDPDCCLVNYYAEGAKMGMHQDRDEGDLSWPVLSISLGDTARFRVGGTTRGGPTQSLLLESGDVALLSGAGRLAYHGIDRVLDGSSRLLPNGGRINLTLRVVA